MRPKSFLFPIVLFVVVLFGATALPFALFMEKQLQKALYHTTRTGVTQNIQRLGAVLEPSVYHKDLSQIKKILYAYMNDPSILGIVLYDTEGTILISVRRTEGGDLIPLQNLLLFRSALPRESYSINHSLFYEGTFEGRVESYISITPPQQRALAFRSSLLYTLCLFAFFFTFFLVLLLQRSLRRPLRDMCALLDLFAQKSVLSQWRSEARRKENGQMTPNDSFDAILSYHEKELGRKNEVGDLAVSLHRVLGYIRQEILRQEKNMETLEENNTRLIEDLCILRQQKIEMEQYLREMEKKMRLFETRHVLPSFEGEEA